jgi:hypothetical protein
VHLAEAEFRRHFTPAFWRPKMFVYKHTISPALLTVTLETEAFGLKVVSKALPNHAHESVVKMVG